MAYHIPVLLQQSVDALSVEPSGVYVDVTFGGGGHSREILRRLGPEGRLVAFDRDADALANRPDDDRLILVHGNFRFLYNYLKYHHISQVDGILADLGVSSHHFDTALRGFTFQKEAPLDMRMNASAPLRAAEVLNQYPEARLREIFRSYGELENAARMAQAVVKARETAPLTTNQELLAAVAGSLPKYGENKVLAKLFQALRIEVNGELNALRDLLFQSVKVLRPGGRMSVITYHSLEDRMVKRFLREGQFEGMAQKDLFGHAHTPFRTVGTRFVTPDEEELSQNSRSRSAKLRVAERV